MIAAFNLAVENALSIGLVASLIYVTGLVIYRVKFSPLAGFPGPKLAAITGWYEFYYDWWLSGKYIFQIEKLHQKYGPIIRINPIELSISDPSFYNEVYVAQYRRRTEPYDAFANGLGFEGSFLLTKDHDLHRNRRKPFEPFFSKKGISSSHHILVEVTSKLEAKIRQLKGTEKVLQLDHAFACYAGDIIGRLCFDHAATDEHREFLDDDEFSPHWYNLLHTIALQIPLFTAFPWIVQAVKLVPKRFLLWTFPQGQSFNTFTQAARQRIRVILNSKYLGGGAERTSLFHTIIDSNMPSSEKTEDRLTMEAQILLAAGTATTARTMVLAIYYILMDTGLQLRLKLELGKPMQGWPERPPTMAELESLPLLQAVIKEALRISYGLTHRLPRVSPDEPLQYGEYVIPPGVPVGMSAYMMHNDAIVYPKPNKFLADRWLTDHDVAMDRNWVPFTRGSRGCLGMNLATAEIGLALAMLFRPGGPTLEIFETDEEDVRLVHDYVIPLPKLSSKGIRVMVV